MKDARQLKYRELCSKERGIPIFSQAWWLDAAVGPANWNAAIVERNGEVVAAMPYAGRSRYGFVILNQPGLTQTLGPWLAPIDGKLAAVLAQQKEWMDLLIQQLPRFDHFRQNWHYTNTNWLPFFWKGYQQTTRYTYVLPDLKDEAILWNGLQSNIRQAIRKASDRCNVRIRRDLDVEAFLDLNRLVFERQGIKPGYSDDYVRALDTACRSQGAREILIAEDSDGRRHAGVYVIWDARSAYSIMVGGDPQLRSSGATSLCMWEAIRFAATVTQSFDFEGSMLEPIEHFYRSFGAVQKPYFSVSKTPSRVLSTVLFLRAMKGMKYQ